MEPAASRRSRSVDALPRIVAFVAVGVWTVVFWRLGALRQDRWETFGFDLGIYDQASWLLAHFRDPFMTVRGLDVFGHHGTFALWLNAPGYWVGWGPKWLLTVQIASQVVGAGALWTLTRFVIPGRWGEWSATGIVVVYLLHPTSGWLVWEYFHPDAVAIGALLVAYVSARTQRWRWCWVASVLALACKEDLATAVAVLGILLAFRPVGARSAWRRATTMVGVAAVWYLAVNKVLIPWRNGGVADFYTKEFFGDLGSSPFAVVVNLVLHPVRSRTWERLAGKDARSYYWALVAPVGVVVPFLEPQVLAIGLPMVLINVVSAQPWTHDFRYHYTAVPLVAVMLATVEGVGFLARRVPRLPAISTVMVGVLVVCSLAMYRAHGVGPGSVAFRRGYWPLRPTESVLDIVAGVDPRAEAVVRAKDDVVRSLPSDASVSAWYSMVPHVSDRALAYQWPNPFIAENWGIAEQRPDDPAKVSWLLLDRVELATSADATPRELFDALLATGEFRITSERRVHDGAAVVADIVLARRVRRPGCLPDPNGDLAAALGTRYAMVAPPSTGKVCPVT